MFHLQLRQFPHNHCQFNLSQSELETVIAPWARGEWIALGERRWSPHQAKLTIIQAPRMQPAQLSMGRGWRHAQRHGQDVTRRMLEAAAAGAAAQRGATAAMPARMQAAASEGSATAPAGRTPRERDVHDEREVHNERDVHNEREMRDLLGGGDAGEALLAMWCSIAARQPQLRPSESLAAAEQKLAAAARELRRSARGGG